MNGLGIFHEISWKQKVQRNFRGLAICRCAPYLERFQRKSQASLLFCLIRFSMASRVANALENQRSGSTEAEHIHLLQQSNDSLPHKLTLEMWEREESVLSRRIEQKEARRAGIQNEIYQLLGLYFVFQGVVISALFQAAAGQLHENTCKNWWSPFSLTMIAFVATLGAVLHKFHAQSQVEDLLEEEKRDCRVLFKSIHDLRSMGTRFRLSKPPPRRNPAPKVGSVAGCWSYRGAITVTLMAFSAITSISCKRLLCPGHSLAPAPG